MQSCRESVTIRLFCSPGKVKRALGAEDIATIAMYAERYVKYKEIYRSEVASGGWRVASENKETK